MREGRLAIWSLIEDVGTPNSFVGGGPYAEEKKHTIAADSASYLKARLFRETEMKCLLMCI